MYLETFTAMDYDVLVNWIPNEEFNYLWGGPAYEYPLTEQQIITHVSRPEVTPFILKYEEKNIGYIELLKESQTTYRLCRVLIGDKSQRGKGHGKVLVELAIDYAKTVLNAKKINLAVFGHNQKAINCYQSLGFEVTGKDTASRSFGGQNWTSLYMEKAL
ncbi:GNAT family N-acetyltransferase [Photobacterium sagamiensis]|uniref:GNAT family N-acetyltransferase n=1 Tax=Photobacterium sagamiensis TaxID=2910241 RepID=UPI003D137851